MQNSNEDDANKRWNKDEAMASVHFFGIAKEYYEKAGKRDKIDELNQKIREATQDIKWTEIKTVIYNAFIESKRKYRNGID